MAKETKESENRPEDQKADAQAKDASKKSWKRWPMLGGGVLGVIALAHALSLVAVPSREPPKKVQLLGPFVVELSPPQGYQVNLAGQGGKHYLAMLLKAEVDAYEENYATARTTAPLYQAKLTDAVLKVASEKTKEDLDDAAGKDVFREELRAALDTVLFPVHVGNELDANARDEHSGLRAGRSMAYATMRGLFYEHELHVEAESGTIRLDDGPETSFQGEETDFAVADAEGRTIHVDLSELGAGFAGEVPVGVRGRVRNVYFGSFLTQ